MRELEQQVKDHETMAEQYKAIQDENYQLREYIIELQSRLIHHQTEVPALPRHIDLSRTRPQHQHQHHENTNGPPTTQTQSVAAQMQAVQAAARTSGGVPDI